MSPYAVEQFARDHYRDLVQLAQAEHVARRAGGGVGRWRQALGRALVAAGVGIGLPRRHRAPALREADALLAACGCQP